jgi:hypothetical protein
MSKTMMFAALLLGFCGTAAHAIEMPEDLVGRWCQAEEMSFSSRPPACFALRFLWIVERQFCELGLADV